MPKREYGPHTQDTPTKEEDRRLAVRAKAGDMKAREDLIVNHLYLVKRLIASFIGKGVPDDVLYQEGCYGLILAVDRFDPDRNTSLDTYAGYYINKYLHRAMIENYPHPIMLKAKSSRHAKKYKEALTDLTASNGRPPSNQELADYLGISYESAAALMASTMQAVALDHPDTEDRLLHERQSRGAEVEALKNLNEMCLDGFPVTLSSREEDVLRLHFGFWPAEEPYTFTQIAGILGISTDTVSSDYHNAIKKLRQAARPHSSPP